MQEVWWIRQWVSNQSKKIKNWLELTAHTSTSLVQVSMICQTLHTGSKFYLTKRIHLISVWRVGLVFLTFHSVRLNFRGKMLHLVLCIHQKYTKLSSKTLVFLLVNHPGSKFFMMKSLLSLSYPSHTPKILYTMTIEYTNNPLKAMAKSSHLKPQRMMKMDRDPFIRQSISNLLSTP